MMDRRCLVSMCSRQRSKVMIIVSVNVSIILLLMFYSSSNTLDFHIFPLPRPAHVLQAVGLMNKSPDVLQLTTEASQTMLNTEHVLQEQRSRQITLHAYCANAQSSGQGRVNDLDLDLDLDLNQLSNIYVVDRYKALYCKVPKVACTNWKKVMLVLNGGLSVKDVSHVTGNDVHHELEEKFLRTLDSYSKKEIQLRLRTYFKFVFVRHPFDRLLSAYRNKFNNSKNSLFPQLYAKHIARANNRTFSKENGTSPHVTFEEFLHYTVEITSEEHNEHWQSYSSLCAFCSVNYDFIGKFETLAQDARFILNRIGSRDVDFPQGQGQAASGSSSWTSVFANISHQLVQQVRHKYSRDFDMFDYN